MDATPQQEVNLGTAASLRQLADRIEQGEVNVEFHRDFPEERRVPVDRGWVTEHTGRRVVRVEYTEEWRAGRN